MKTLLRRPEPRRRGSAWPNLVLAMLLLAAFTAAAVGPRAPAGAPVLASVAGQPVVTTVSPATGPDTGGTSVTITGTGFTGATAVTFSSANAASFTVDSPTQITAVTPAGLAGPAIVQVAIGACTSSVSGATFLYTPAIVIPPLPISIAPPTGDPAGGTAVTISGLNLDGVLSVTIGGNPATSVVGVSSSSITAVTPAHAPGNVPVSVTTAGGTGVVPGGYTYVAAEAQGHAASHGEQGTPAMRKVFYQMPGPVCPTPPDAPSPVTATAGTSSINVSWTVATPHVAPVTGYTATASPGPATCTTLVTDPTPLSCVLGATAGVQYTVSVVANSAAGASAPATSEPVTPSAPVVPDSPPDTPLTLTTDKGHITTAEPGQDIVVIGTGFAAYSTATITLYSDPMTLGIVVTDGNGDFSKPVTVPASLAAGQHTLVAQGVAPSGNPRAMKMAITVGPAGAGLAVTGAPAGPIALAGLVLLLAGATLTRPWVWYRRIPR